MIGRWMCRFGMHDWWYRESRSSGRISSFECLTDDMKPQLFRWCIRCDRQQDRRVTSESHTWAIMSEWIDYEAKP